MLYLAYFRNVASKSTVYRPSRFAFLKSKLHFFYSENNWWISSRIIIRASLWPLLAEKCALFGLFSKSCSKSTVHWLSRFTLLKSNMFFSTWKVLVDFQSNLHQSIIRDSFCRKMCSIWPIFKTLLQKVQSIRCLDSLFWSRKCSYFIMKMFGRFLVESLSEYRYAHFWPKNVLHVTYFRKVTAKSTVAVSIHILNPKMFF